MRELTIEEFVAKACEDAPNVTREIIELRALCELIAPGKPFPLTFEEDTDGELFIRCEPTFARLWLEVTDEDLLGRLRDLPPSA